MVPVTLPGERIRARVVRNHKNFSEADLVGVLVPSPDRTAPSCPLFGRCGGCQYQHLTYAEERRLKENQVREAFARELLAIARGRETSLTVLYANSRIQRVEALSGLAPAVERYDGGGFTDLRPVFAYAKTMHPLPAAVIYLTDGIGPVPPRMEFPTLWVLTCAGEKPAPWGIELRLEV